jgi:hypothetical protein
MARRPILAEDLADETGRIRPEVADLLMEPAEVGDDRLMEPAPPEPRPQQRYGEVLQEMPWESFSHTIVFFLGLLLFSLLSLWIASYRLSSRAAMEEKQVSNSATQTEENSGQTITKKKAPPIFNQGNIENDVNSRIQDKKLEEEKGKISDGTYERLPEKDPSDSTNRENLFNFYQKQCGPQAENARQALRRYIILRRRYHDYYDGRESDYKDP